MIFRISYFANFLYFSQANQMRKNAKFSRNDFPFSLETLIHFQAENTDKLNEALGCIGAFTILIFISSSLKLNRKLYADIKNGLNLENYTQVCRLVYKIVLWEIIFIFTKFTHSIW